MAISYKTPGVYIEEISKFPPSVAQVETAIPAFIGFTELTTWRGETLVNQPLRIGSLLEYEQIFGTAQTEKNLSVTRKVVDGEETITTSFGGDASTHNMYYSLQAYFANGGGPCYIISVGGYAVIAVAGAAAGGGGAGGGAGGAGGGAGGAGGGGAGGGAAAAATPAEALTKGLDALAREDEPTLIIFPEAQTLSKEDQRTLYQAALTQCGTLQDRFLIADFHDTGETLAPSDLPGAMDEFRKLGSPFIKYGAAYFPNVHTTFDYRYDEADVKVDNDGTAKKLSELKDTDGALYGRIRGALSQHVLTLPPSPIMAGIYARVDNLRGVHKAPANESISAASGLTFKVTEELQKNLNVDTTAGKSINALRAFTGRGLLVWGARTLDGNSNEWRYVPVRRFFNMVEESTKKASGRFVFEPNDKNTWVKVRAMIENFLVLQWRGGALQGAKPEQAFYVKVGLGETMTALDILEGRMIVEIGMAVVRPAEFIILRFAHKMPEA